jgi:hypothetical protein
MKRGIWAALGAAVLFGLSTRLAKLLTGQASALGTFKNVMRINTFTPSQTLALINILPC